MCGRYVTPGQAEIERDWHYGWPGNSPERDIARIVYNAAPTQRLPVFRIHAERGPELVRLRWGLIPSWAKDAAIGARMINARGETVAEKPAFRAAFRRRRCLVPMKGFYEWKKTASGKLPHFIYLKNADIFAAAGLYEYWPGRDGAEPVESYTIITTEANDMMAKLHDRMPVILAEKDHAVWLDPKHEGKATLQALLKPFPPGEMLAYPVSTRVNNPKNDDPELLSPAGSLPDLQS